MDHASKSFLANDRFGSNPNAIFNYNFSKSIGEATDSVVVIASKKHCSLRDAYVVAHRYICQIIDPDRLSYPAVVAHNKSPRILNNHPGLYYQALTYFSAEGYKNPTFQSIRPWKRTVKNVIVNK